MGCGFVVNAGHASVEMWGVYMHAVLALLLIVTLAALIFLPVIHLPLIFSITFSINVCPPYRLLSVHASLDLHLPLSIDIVAGTSLPFFFIPPSTEFHHLIIMTHVHHQGVSEDEAASSSGEEEDAQAKAARLGMRMAGGGAAASRPSRRAEGVSATASKKRKRARDAVVAPGEEDSRHNRLASSSGPLAVDQGDTDASRSTAVAEGGWACLLWSSVHRTTTHLAHVCWSDTPIQSAFVTPVFEHPANDSVLRCTTEHKPNDLPVVNITFAP